MPSERQKKLFSNPEFIASLRISSRTNLAGLFYPTPPSIREKDFELFIFFISADGKNVGAALVALATSLIKKFLFWLSIAKLLLNNFADDFPYFESLLTAVTITCIPGRTSDSLQF